MSKKIKYPKKNILYSTEIIGPSLKNKINLDKSKDYHFFLNKYVNKYDANKNHSKHNFLKWVENKSIDKFIENIPKKKYRRYSRFGKYDIILD